MTNAIEKLDRDLTDARERLRRRDRFRAHLPRIEEDLWAARKKLEPLEAAMKREAADVRRLEGQGLTALFYTILGSKEQQLEKERQEALAARLKHDEAAFAVAALADEERRCTSELAGLADVETRYQELLAAKEKVLHGKGKEVSRRLVEISDRVGGNRADLKEINEAFEAGLRARTSLEVIVDRLRSAENWGSWDLWAGGGIIVTSMKHRNLDDAQTEAHRAQQHLRAFGRELQDVGEQLEAGIQMDGFTKFADWFFDGLIIDWLVQNQIRDSLKAAENVATLVRAKLNRLEERRSTAREKLARAEEERRDFIEKS
jgi:hypothetical protein